MKAIRKIFVMLAFLLVFAACAQAAPEEATTIFVVRHAEKADQGDDPDLTPLGQERARQLAHILQKAGVQALYASQFKRTRQTLQPLADALNLQTIIMDANDLDGLVRRVSQENRGGAAAIASHSNLVPEILRRLGAANDLVITEQQYDDLFIVILRNGSAQLLHLKYGRPTE